MLDIIFQKPYNKQTNTKGEQASERADMPTLYIALHGHWPPITTSDQIATKSIARNDPQTLKCTYYYGV